jgi:hypothetical protein
MKLEKVVKSDAKNKKWMAIFCMCNGKSKCCDKDKKKVHFGDSRYTDFTMNKRTPENLKKRENYRKRHASGKFAKPDTPDALAYHILWGESVFIQSNIADYKKKFNL